MTEVEYRQTGELNLAFFKLVQAGILDIEDEEQPLEFVLQKISKPRKELETEIRRLSRQQKQARVTPSQKQLDLAHSDLIVNQSIGLNCVDCPCKNEVKMKKYCPRCPERKKSDDQKFKTPREVNGSQGRQRSLTGSSTESFRLTPQGLKQKSNQCFPFC